MQQAINIRYDKKLARFQKKKLTKAKTKEREILGRKPLKERPRKIGKIRTKAFTEFQKYARLLRANNQ